MEHSDISDIFKLRLAAIREVDPAYYNDNKKEMITSAEMAQELINSGKPVTDKALNDVHKKYNIDRGGDISPFLVEALIEGYQQDVVHGIIDEKGKIIAKCSGSSVLQVPHVSSERGMPANAVQLIATVDKNKPQPVPNRYHNPAMMPIFEVRMQALQEISPLYFNDNKHFMEQSVQAAQLIIDQNLPLTTSVLENVCKQKGIDAGGDINPLEIADLVNAYHKDFKNGYIDKSGRVIAKCSKSNVMNVQHAFSPKPNTAKTFLKQFDENISGNKLVNRLKHLRDKMYKKSGHKEEPKNMPHIKQKADIFPSKERE